MRQQKILVVDDEHLIRWSLEQNLKKQGYEVVTAATGEDALKLLKDDVPDLMLLDIQLPGIDGLAVLERVKEMEEEIIVIMVTALGVLETAVKAMRMGAYDYINKPFNLDELAIVIKKALETGELRREVAHLRSEQSRKYGSGSIIGRSRHMQNVLTMVDKVAKSDAGTILIQGESGTGKELIAKAIHYQSGRAERPFMGINCAAVPETLLESELMGHERGAFTDAKVQKKGLLEMADGGTLFLDEIGDMPLALQGRLLRVLETKEVVPLGGKPVRVEFALIAATHRDLPAEVEAGRFRADLYYRLAGLTLTLPPLRERSDLPVLVERILRACAPDRDLRLAPEVAAAFAAHSWPGNVRELAQALRVAAALVDEEEMVIGWEALPEGLAAALKQRTSMSPSVPQGQEETLELATLSRAAIERALVASRGNRTAAARRLGISRATLYRKLREMGSPPAQAAG